VAQPKAVSYDAQQTRGTSTPVGSIGDIVRRRLKRGFAVFVCLLLVAAAAGVPVYVRPQTDQLRHADAILVLSGPYHRRYPFGFELAEQGWAPNLVISNPSGGYDRSLVDYCAAPHPTFAVHCFVPDPTTTRGEARELRRLAAQYGWRTVIVVTFQPHVSRARFILSRCFDGDLVMVASPAPISGPRWAYEYLYQTAGYVRAALQPGC
jgi:uncharacterized SAM-binding protein YcdF (DUF218 family)